MKEDKQRFDVLAVPCDRAFVIAADKTEEFLNQKPDPLIRKEQAKVLQKFKRQIVVKKVDK